VAVGAGERDTPKIPAKPPAAWFISPEPHPLLTAAKLDLNWAGWLLLWMHVLHSGVVLIMGQTPVKISVTSPDA
jgi:hypothetical protein